MSSVMRSGDATGMRRCGAAGSSHAEMTAAVEHPVLRTCISRAHHARAHSVTSARSCGRRSAPPDPGAHALSVVLAWSPLLERNFKDSFVMQPRIAGHIVLSLIHTSADEQVLRVRRQRD